MRLFCREYHYKEPKREYEVCSTCAHHFSTWSAQIIMDACGNRKAYCSQHKVPYDKITNEYEKTAKNEWKQVTTYWKWVKVTEKGAVL